MANNRSSGQKSCGADHVESACWHRWIDRHLSRRRCRLTSSSRTSDFSCSRSLYRGSGFRASGRSSVETARHLQGLATIFCTLVTRASSAIYNSRYSLRPFVDDLQHRPTSQQRITLRTATGDIGLHLSIEQMVWSTHDGVCRKLISLIAPACSVLCRVSGSYKGNLSLYVTAT